MPFPFPVSDHCDGARFFNAVRHTVSDRILATYRTGEPKPDLAHLAANVKP